MNSTRKNMKQIVAAVERTTGDGEVKTWWTRVGVAFENQDGSWNLRFDFLPTDPKTTLQLRDLEQRQERTERPQRARRLRSPRRNQHREQRASQ